LRDLGVDERILLKCKLEKYGVKVWAGFSWLRIGPVDSYCAYIDKSSCSIKFGEFPDR
jgi:hypothetical protein